jgi:CRP-like cAMP-binding protein
MDTNDPDGAEVVRFGDEVVANSSWHLRRSRLFAGVREDVVARYTPAFTLRSVPAGRSVVGDGSAERNVHVIRRGKVRIEHRVSADTVLVVSVLGSGDVFGLETVVGDPVPVRTAHCVRETLLLSAPSECVRPALDESARLARNVAESLAQTLDGFALALRGLVHAPCSKRVFQTLEQIAREHGVGVADGTLLDVALTPEDIAAVTDSSIETVAMAFFFLEREGHIRTDGSLITLLRTG